MGRRFSGVSESVSILPLPSKEEGLHAGTISVKTVAPSPFIKPFYISAIAVSSPPFLLTHPTLSLPVITKMKQLPL